MPNLPSYGTNAAGFLYAVNPVDAISQLDQETFQSLRRFVMGFPIAGQTPLNETDQLLMFQLYTMEATRRDSSRDEFSLYLQEKRESNEQYLRRGDRDAITIDGWIDLFRLNLMLR